MAYLAAETVRRVDHPGGERISASPRTRRAVAIQFPLGHPAVAAVLSGSSSPAHLADNMAMMMTDIPDDLWLELRHAHLIYPEAPVPAG
jgi:aryl-alcohol dehydrogenase-like predicted oxidoreductase